MPLRTASLSRQIRLNGARLHQAIAARLHSHAEGPASEREVELIEERRALKEAQAKRRADALLPRAKPQPAWMSRPARPVAKAPKAPRATEYGTQAK